MPDPKSRCIEAALRPLDNEAETKIAATGAIQDSINASSEQDLEEATRRWLAAEGKTSWPTRYILGALIALSCWILAKDYREVSWYFTLTNHARGAGLFSPPPAVPDYLMEKIEGDKKFLFSKDLAGSSEERFRKLVHSFPENPAYFSAYSVAYIGEHSRLPPGFHETVGRIDPENAWFKYLEAGLLSKNSVKEDAAGTLAKAKPPGSIKLQAWQISSQPDFDRSLELIRQAAALPKCDSYGAQIMREQINAFPHGSLGDTYGFTNAITSMNVSHMTLLHIHNAISARAQQLEGSNDLAGFERLSEDAARCLKASGIEPDSAVNGLLVNTLSARMINQLAATSSKLNAADADNPGKPSENAFVEWMKRRKSYAFRWEGGTEEDFKRVAGMGLISGATMIARLAPDHQPAFSIRNLEPIRWAEHDLLSRLLSYPLWLFLGLILTATIGHQKLSSRLSRRLGNRMTALLDLSDWAWILIIGVVLPFCYVAVINRFTPLGGRHLGLIGNSALMPAGHLVGLLALWLVAPVSAARWRLSVRGKVLGMSRPPASHYFVIIFAAAFVPVVGWAALSRKMPDFWEGVMTWNSLESAFAPGFPFEFWTATTLLAVSVLWMLWSASSGVFGISINHIQRAATARVLTVTFTCSLLLISLSAVALKQSERHWYAKDTLLRANPDFPSWTPHEYRVAVQMRSELKKNLGLAD